MRVCARCRLEKMCVEDTRLGSNYATAYSKGVLESVMDLRGVGSSIQHRAIMKVGAVGGTFLMTDVQY